MWFVHSSVRPTTANIVFPVFTRPVYSTTDNFALKKLLCSILHCLSEGAAIVGSVALSPPAIIKY